MNIDVEKLKHMQAQEIKRRKGINRISLIIGIILLMLFGYFFTVQAQNYPTWKLIGGLVFGMLLIVIILLIVVYFVFNFASRRFIKELDRIVQENDNTSGQVYYDALIQMQPQPETFDEFVYWYFNLSTALYRLGNYQEGLEVVTAVRQALDSNHPMNALYADQEKYLRMKL